MIRLGRTAGRPHRAITGRALVLGALVVLVLVVLASPLSRYFASRSALDGAAAQLHGDRQQLGRLTHQLAQWQDPGYVQQQARERLEYAMPGDTVYVVVDRGAKNEIARTSGVTDRPPVASGWNTRLWASVQSADAATR